MSWISESIATLKALSSAEHAPVLGAYPSINIDFVPPASVLLVYGFPGNKATQRLGVNKYGVPFHPPFHAAVTIRDGLFHNVGQWRTDMDIRSLFKSTRRVDALIYSMDEPQRREIVRAAELDTSTPKLGLNITDYGISQFLNFGFSFIRDGDDPVCSVDVVKVMAAGGITCSGLPANDTAPWDIQMFAMDHPREIEIRTLWVGDDYHP